MARYINIADDKGRNAEIVFTGKSKKSKVKQLTSDGNPVKTVRVLKGTIDNSYEKLIVKHGDADKLANAIIQTDPEINAEYTGRFVRGMSKLYIDSAFKPATKIHIKEIVHNPDGSVKEERVPKETLANILAEAPVRGGKLFPRKEVYNKFVFARKYQLHHINGLTFDFLFEIAKELQEKDSLMMLGAGDKGNQPLVFQDGGKSYRAFLEGRIKGNSYILLVHLSNLELKGLAV